MKEISSVLLFTLPAQRPIEICLYRLL